MTHNIFVEDNRISSVIDWRDCRIGPQFLQARHPQLVRYSGEMMTDLPEDFETLTDKEEEARIWSQVEKTLVLLTYETHSKHLSALLEQIERVPQMQNRRDTVDMSGSTWESGLIPLRQCLIRVARWVLFIFFFQVFKRLGIANAITCQTLGRDRTRYPLSDRFHSEGNRGISSRRRGLERIRGFLGPHAGVRGQGWVDGSWKL